MALCFAIEAAVDLTTLEINPLAKIAKGEEVNTSILVKICNALDCRLDEIVEYNPTDRSTEVSKECQTS